MKEKATGFEALKGVGAPLKELIDKKGKSFSGFGELIIWIGTGVLIVAAILALIKKPKI